MLAYVHREKIVHDDINPANILITEVAYLQREGPM
ncbi:hypothetical protein SLEP1_g46139 [Rubroshorea leprosula]|uniref:Protein kinase domain-containing protein n=1 Tax=Rubroshorea leprosula TaxID=152421 RepID=A0AAV5LM68_9ROSI|nr:hypothetical protein SLEP1_g46139 [Rubroshorea leprosula]